MVNHYILYLKYNVICPLYLKTKTKTKTNNPLVSIKMQLSSHIGVSLHTEDMSLPKCSWLSWDCGTPTSSTLCSFDIKLQKRKRVLH